MLLLDPKGLKKEHHADFDTILNSEDIEAAMENLAWVLERRSQIQAGLAEKLDTEVEHCLFWFYFPGPRKKRVRTTNCRERFN